MKKADLIILEDSSIETRMNLLEDFLDKWESCECVEICNEKMRVARLEGKESAGHYCKKCKMTWLGTVERVNDWK